MIRASLTDSVVKSDEVGMYSSSRGQTVPPSDQMIRYII